MKIVFKRTTLPTAPEVPAWIPINESKNGKIIPLTDEVIIVKYREGSYDVAGITFTTLRYAQAHIITKLYERGDL